MPDINLGLIFGGRSVEHEVSIITAYQALGALDKRKYRVTPVYLARDNVWYIGSGLEDISFFRVEQPQIGKLTRVLPCPDAARGKLRLVEASPSGLRKPRITELDLVIPATHGTFGEDGCLQGMLEMAGVPYAGSGVYASAVGMDKLLTKAVLEAEGLPFLPYTTVTRTAFEADPSAVLNRIEAKPGYPVIVKPARLGSSIGVSMADSRVELEEALDLALRFGERVLVERCIEGGIEVNCAVLDSDPPTPSVLEQPVKSSDHLTFDDKYRADQKGIKGSKDGKGMAGQKRLIPAPISSEQTRTIQDLAVRFFSAIRGGGVTRVDFLIDEKKEIFVNEINNIPGSFSFYLWEYMGRTFSELLDRMIDRAFEVRKRSHRTIYSFDANLLASGRSDIPV